MEQSRDHKVFKDLAAYEDFYKSLSFGVMSFVQFGTTEIINFDTYIYSSIQGTLQSIRLILETGRTNDAYALLRKYYDLAMINAYTMLFLDDKTKWFEGSFERENQVNNWIQGKEQLPKFGMIKQYIMRSEKLKEINEFLYKDGRYTSLRERCNGNTHYNYFYHAVLNDSEMYADRRDGILNRFAKDAEDIFVLHFIYTFTISSHYMASSDHLDYLEMGQTPPRGSELWVAPVIQSTFDNIVKPSRPDLAMLLKNATSMQLE